MTRLKDFAECGLCGTAAVISPVGKIVDHGKEICFPSGMDAMGPVTQKLYEDIDRVLIWRVIFNSAVGLVGSHLNKSRL